ncbi:MAG: hypothetical protein R3E96_14540 [Planctomycetota bacterium]
MSAAAPELSVLVVSYQTRELTLEAVRSLLAETLRCRSRCWR